MTMPTHIYQHLAATGHINHDGISRKARLRSCRRCGGPVIVGLDAERCGLTTTADPTDLDQVAELLALALGRSTYSLTAAPTLERRHQWAIRGRRHHPAVLVDHRCRDGVPLRIGATVRQVFEPTLVTSVITDTPPY